MKIESLHINMRVRHPQYGTGTVKTISEVTADIQFDDGSKRAVAPEPSGLEPAEPQVGVSGLNVPLKQFIAETLDEAVRKLGLEKPDSVVEKLGAALARRQTGFASGGPGVADEGGAAGNFFPQNRDGAEQSPRAGTENQRARETDRRREGGDAAIHHAQPGFADHVQRAVSGKGRSVLKMVRGAGFEPATPSV